MAKKIKRGSAIIALVAALTTFAAGPAVASPGKSHGSGEAGWSQDASWGEQ